MWIGTQAKRLVFLVHRWTGVAACLLMALWVFSGMVMLFVGYPQLLPTQRLAALPPLADMPCCIPVEAALQRSRAPQAVQQITLTTIAGRPSYRLQEGDGHLTVVDAASGALAPQVDVALALRSAQAFVPGFGATVVAHTQDDRWTHSAALDAHRPLIQVQMQDPLATLLYVSSATGEVVMAAPRAQRYWNHVGAWLHWLYMFRDGSRDAVWSWLVIGLSALGTLSALAGALVGIWRWRFRGRYKSGSKTPYRELPMRWHHITGLVFGALLILWIFSGLMSMNPVGIFSPAGELPDLQAYRQATPASTRPTIATGDALALLQSAGFAARELEWKVLGGQPYLLARDGAGASRLVLAAHGSYEVRMQFDAAQLAQAAQHLVHSSMRAAVPLAHYDAYYYPRGPASMYAAADRALPVLRVHFEDPGSTTAYLSVYTGDVVLSLDCAQRVGRWLFNFLHSWDLPWMLHQAAQRDLVLVLWGLGAGALALTGTVLGYRRLRRLAPGASRGVQQGARWSAWWGMD